MVGTAGSWTSLGGGSYSATITFSSDLTGNSYLPTQITTAFELVTGTPTTNVLQRFDITAVSNTTLTQADIVVSQISPTNSAPAAFCMAYNSTAFGGFIPQVPFASAGTTGQLQAAVDSYNAKFSSTAKVPGAANALDTLNGFSLSGPDGFLVSDIVANGTQADIYADSSNVFTKPIAYSTAQISTSGTYAWDVSKYPQLAITATGNLDIAPKNAVAGQSYILNVINGSAGYFISLSNVLTNGQISRAAYGQTTVRIVTFNGANGITMSGDVVVLSNGIEMDLLSEFRDSVDYAVFASLGSTMQDATTQRRRAMTAPTVVMDIFEATKAANVWTTNTSSTAPSLVVDNYGAAAIDFDGSNDYLNASNATTYDNMIETGVFTLLLRVKKTTDGVLDRIVSGGSTNGFHLAVNSSNQMTFLTQAGGVTTCTVTNTTTVMASDGWFYVELVGNGATVVLYVTKAGVTTSASASITPTPIVGMVGLCLGASAIGTDSFFDGLINYAVLSNRAMSQAAIAKFRAIPLTNLSFASIRPIAPYRWYDFSSSTMWQDDAKTTLATANNDPVQRVKNKAGGSWAVNDMDIQGTGNFTLKTALQNGINGIQTDTTKYASLNGGIISDWTAFFVFNCQDTTTSSKSILSSSNAGAHKWLVVNLSASTANISAPGWTWVQVEPAGVYDTAFQQPMLRVSNRMGWNVLGVRRKGLEIAYSVNGGELLKTAFSESLFTQLEWLSYNGSSAGFKGFFGEAKIFNQALDDGYFANELSSMITKWAIPLVVPNARTVSDNLRNDGIVLKDGKDETSDRNYVSFPSCAKSIEGNGSYIWTIVRVSDTHSVDVDVDQTLELHKFDYLGNLQAGYPKIIYQENLTDNQDMYEGFMHVVNKDGIGGDSLLIAYSLYPGTYQQFFRWYLPNETFTTRVAINFPADDAEMFINDEIIIDTNGDWYVLSQREKSNPRLINVHKSTNQGTTWVRTFQDSGGVGYGEAQWGELADGQKMILVRVDVPVTPPLNANAGTVVRIVAPNWDFVGATTTTNVTDGQARPNWRPAPDGTIAFVTRLRRSEQYSMFKTSRDLGLTWTPNRYYNTQASYNLKEQQMYADVIWKEKRHGKNVWIAIGCFDYNQSNAGKMMMHELTSE